MNTVHQNIVVHRYALLDSAVTQREGQSTHNRDATDPEPVLLPETQQVALLQLSLFTSFTTLRARRPTRAEEQKGGHLDIRV